MLQAAQILLHYYQDLAPSLAEAHHIPYPETLVRIGQERLEKLGTGKYGGYAHVSEGNLKS